jgi:hypothetical protein
MFSHHDIGWWGFVLAAIGLVLAYPLDLAAHLSAPKVKNWWAERSLKSLDERINKLEKERMELAPFPFIGSVELQILRSIDRLGFLLAQSVHLLLCVAVFWVVPPERRWDVLYFDQHVFEMQALIGFVILTNYFAYWAVMRRTRKYADRGSQSYRSKLDTTIRRLRIDAEKKITKVIGRDP